MEGKWNEPVVGIGEIGEKWEDERWIDYSASDDVYGYLGRSFEVHGSFFPSAAVGQKMAGKLLCGMGVAESGKLRVMGMGYIGFGLLSAISFFFFLFLSVLSAISACGIGLEKKKNTSCLLWVKLGLWVYWALSPTLAYDYYPCSSFEFII